MIADRSFEPHNQLADPFIGLRPPGRRSRRPPRPSQRRLHAVPPGDAAALPAAPAQRLRFPPLQPPSLQRRAAGPDRHRQRPDAEAGAAPPDPARTGGAGRGRSSTSPGRAAQSIELRSGPRHDGRGVPGARPYAGCPDAVPGRTRSRARPHPGAARAAAAPWPGRGALPASRTAPGRSRSAASSRPPG